MASSKKIGFFWGEEKLTLVEFAENTPLREITSALGSKTNASSPFSSNFTEEIQITAIFQKLLQDNQITGGRFYISLPVKEIILRSFVIPFIKHEDISLWPVIEFEAKKYLPIDIKDLTCAYYASPFTENQVKRLQVVFFGVRKESLERYGRIFKQVNAVISYCEPCVVSLAKVLLFKKEISPTDHLAFLILDKNSGRICFIDQGIPQFIREFSLSFPSPSEETKDSIENLNLRIVNEVGNSFDFYARQFRGGRIDYMLVSTEGGSQDLFNALETELKLKIRKASPVVTMGAAAQSNDIDTIYAMGACVEAPLPSLSKFNFVEDKTPKSKLQSDFIKILKPYKEIIFIFLICMIALAGVHIFFQVQLKAAQQQYDQLASKQGAFLNEPIEGIQAEWQQNMTKLTAYKNIKTKSDVVLILLRVASHLPKGALLQQLSVTYGQDGSNAPSGPNETGVNIEMKGNVAGEDPNEEMAVVDQIFSDFKNDKELSQYVKTVDLVSINREDFKDRKVTGFDIHCF